MTSFNDYQFQIIDECKPHSFIDEILKSKIKDLDTSINSFKKGGLYILTGKWWAEIDCLFINLLVNLKSQANVYCYCHNDSPESVSESLLSNQTGIVSEKIKRKTLSDEEFELLKRQLSIQNEFELLFNEVPAIDFANFLEEINEAVIKKSIKVVFINSILEFLTDLNKPIDIGLRQLKQFAVINNIVIISTYQFKKISNPQNFYSFKQDQNSQLINKHFDVVITTYRPPLEGSDILSNDFILKIEKNRFGDLESIQTKVDLYRYKITDIDFASMINT